MKVLYTPWIVVLVLGIEGCMTQLPEVAEWPPATQQKLWVAQQWDDVARQVAERLAAGLRSVRRAGQPLVLYVEKPQSFSAFDDAFHQLLLTQLLTQGFSLTSDPNAGLPLRYNAQLVTHDVSYPPPDAELIVNVSVMSGERYLSRLSEVYYVAPYDLPLYLAQGPVVTRPMEVVGP
jgi:hypothetical protein